MERSAIRDSSTQQSHPDFAALNPPYGLFLLHHPCVIVAAGQPAAAAPARRLLARRLAVGEEVVDRRAGAVQVDVGGAELDDRAQPLAGHGAEVEVRRASLRLRRRPWAATSPS